MKVDLQAAQQRAEKWLDSSTTRETAINEQVMALDVLDLVDEVGSLRQSLDLAYGPHCPSCGNPIDPDTCHCGQSADQHGGEYHGFCPMGCMCGFPPDWQALAKSRGDLVGKSRRELAEMTKARDEACDGWEECRPDSLSGSEWHPTETIERLRAIGTVKP